MPLLEEYCYDRPAALQQILGKNFWNDAGSRVRHELFDSGRDEELLSALLEPCQDLAASVAVSTSEEESEDVADDDETGEQPAA